MHPPQKISKCPWTCAAGWAVTTVTLVVPGCSSERSTEVYAGGAPGADGAAAGADSGCAGCDFITSGSEDMSEPKLGCWRQYFFGGIWLTSAVKLTRVFAGGEQEEDRKSFLLLLRDYEWRSRLRRSVNCWPPLPIKNRNSTISKSGNQGKTCLNHPIGFSFFQSKRGILGKIIYVYCTKLLRSCGHPLRKISTLFAGGTRKRNLRELREFAALTHFFLSPSVAYEKRLK